MMILAASLLEGLFLKASDSKLKGSFKLGMGTLSNSAALTIAEAESEINFARWMRSEDMIGRLKGEPSRSAVHL